MVSEEKEGTMGVHGDLLSDLLTSVRQDAPVREVRTCIHWTAVVSKHCGLASSIHYEQLPHGHEEMRGVGTLHERTALELARYATSDMLLEASVGLAAVNSLIDVDEERCVELNAGDWLAERGRGKRVVVVGSFPFVPRLREKVGELWVLERHPSEGELLAEEAGEIIPQADVVAITGTALINHTLGDLLDLCQPESSVMVLGPSTPLSPVLFDYGVDVISGTKVVDTDLVLTLISQGATFRQVKGPGVRLLTMTSSRSA
jgi:uncharacterized protein (DUF4213/DUF364 family)